jgi:hypothetical protein
MMFALEPEVLATGRHVSRPPRWLLAVAAAWFALAGAVSGLLTVVGAWSVISAGLSGCVLMIEGLGVRFPVAPDPLGCTQRVDLLSMVLSGLASIVLLATLGWLAGSRRGSRWVPLGAVAAVLAGIQPLILVVWFIDRGNVTGGPIELAVGIVPLAWSVVSAAVALAAWRGSRA